MSGFTSFEKKLVLLLCVAQFVNVLDFMMVMPLGPDFARGLQVSLSSLGLIGGSYTFAAGIAAVIGSSFLDRFCRKKALTWSLVGLSFATCLGGFAVGLPSLIAARVIAGIFGGPATSIGIAMLADVIPVQRRGRAMGVVMGAFSLASIFGVPAGLELARLWDWRLPFWAVGAVAFILASAIWTLLPPMTGHLNKGTGSVGTASQKIGEGYRALFKRPEVSVSLIMIAVASFGVFIMVPNLAAYYIENLGFPRDSLGQLYFIGGLITFFSMRFAGTWVDRKSAFWVCAIATLPLMWALVEGFIFNPVRVSVYALFVVFMVSTSTRRVALNALASRVPDAKNRARFLSLQSASQHLASSVGAFFSSALLSTGTTGKLVGMDLLGVYAVVVAFSVPGLIAYVEKRVRRAERLAALDAPSAPLPFS